VARYSDDAPRPVREDFDFDEPYPRFDRGRDRFDRRLRWGPLAAAAAAGFAIAIWFGPCRAHPQLETGEGDLANASSQPELQSAQDRAQPESAPSAKHESVGKADASERGAKADTPKDDALEPGAPERKQETAPAPKRERHAELTPEEVLRKEPTANPEAAKEAEPQAATVAIPEAAKETEPSRTEPDQIALAEPQRVAAVSAYDLPDSVGPVDRATSRSGTPGLPALQALAPERAGWTTEAQPTLYWHASEGTQFPCEFKLTREGEDEPLVRVQLPAPGGAGIQRIELSQFGVTLDEGASYRWSVSLVDLEHSGADLAIGGIRRVAPPETLRAITDASAVPEHLDALEHAGIWYDALDLVTRLIERNPGAENLVARRNAMLARVGIHLPSS
jgi:hypothetical protein